MTFEFQGIDHIQMTMPKGEENKAREFYSKILGMKEIPKPENLQGRGGCWFMCGNQEIHMSVQEDFTPPKKAHPGLIVKNSEELREKLLSLKFEIKEEPPIEGRTRFFVNDPFGNRIEFLEFH
jgi:catechol 2,3-dioxygenase-like lactoylglutathione lyase family enzyme